MSAVAVASNVISNINRLAYANVYFFQLFVYNFLFTFFFNSNQRNNNNNNNDNNDNVFNGNFANNNNAGNNMNQIAICKYLLLYIQ